MTTQTEALKLALELLAVGTFHSPELQAKRTEIIEQGLNALAQPEQKPVAFPDAPQTIYLQVGDECPEGAKWKELVDVCWCDEQVFDNDIVYVRADTTPPQRKPEQEPVALMEKFSLLLWDYQELERAFEKATGGKWVRKNNTPQRTWVGLTDEERNVINRQNIYVSDIISATEAKLKEKNT